MNIKCAKPLTILFANDLSLQQFKEALVFSPRILKQLKRSILWIPRSGADVHNNFRYGSQAKTMDNNNKLTQARKVLNQEAKKNWYCLHDRKAGDIVVNKIHCCNCRGSYKGITRRPITKKSRRKISACTKPNFQQCLNNKSGQRPYL
mgnify:CR=1 FL=1